MSLNRKFKRNKSNRRKGIMKVLNFTEENQENYRIIYEGLCTTRKQLNGKETRRLDKVFTAFESIGKVTGEKLGTNDFYEIKSTPITLEIEDADYELVKSCIEPPNVPWNGIGMRKGGIALLWLDEVPDKTTEPKLVKEK